MREGTDADVIAWLEEEYAQPFSGWDFSRLKERRIPMGSVPWDYNSIVTDHLRESTCLLEIDTGGGEVFYDLLKRADFKGEAHALEAYAPNVPVARKRLDSLGVEVHDISERSAEFTDEAFDLVINRHGGSLTPEEIARLVKRGGYFVTEQIGDRGNIELRELFDSHSPEFPDWPHNAKDAERVFSELGFEITLVAEHTYPVRFVDVGALVYFLKAIPWEVPEFSVSRNKEELLRLNRESGEQGYVIEATYHAYMLAGRKTWFWSRLCEKSASADG